jgi:hypothetical protein
MSQKVLNRKNLFADRFQAIAQVGKKSWSSAAALISLAALAVRRLQQTSSRLPASNSRC